MSQRKTWTAAEDNALKELYQKRGIKKWAEISRILHKEFKIQNKSGKQCRERYHNHLDISIKHEKWSTEEEALLMQLQEQVGNKWAQISRSIPGRSQNCVKNKFYSILRRGLRRINSILRSRLKRYKQLQINILYKIIQSSVNTDNQSLQENSFSLKKQIAFYGIAKDDNRNLDLKRVKKLIEKIKDFGKNGSKKKSSSIKNEERQRDSEEIQSSQFRDNFPVNEEKEPKESKLRRNSLYSFHLEKQDEKNQEEATEVRNICPSPGLMPQNSLRLRKTSISNLSHQEVLHCYSVTSPKFFDVFSAEGYFQHHQNSVKSPTTGIIQSPYFDQLRSSIYSSWYNLYPH